MPIIETIARQETSLLKKNNKAEENSTKGSMRKTSNPNLPGHLLLDTDNIWQKVKLVNHPTLEFAVSVSTEDYTLIDKKPSSIKPSMLTVVKVTSTQLFYVGTK